MLWVPLLFPAVPVLYYCTGVFLTTGNIYLLFSGHGGVFALVLFDFWCILLLLSMMVELPA